MIRLTYNEPNGKWGIVGMDESNQDQKMYAVAIKLMHYEKIGLNPDEVERMKKHFEEMEPKKNTEIRQRIQKDLVVQTELRVTVDGVPIRYTRLPDDFAYEFVVNGVNNQDEIDIAHEKIRKVVTAMINQSFDHGSSWRETDTKICTDRVERYAQYVERVYFRIRDAG